MLCQSANATQSVLSCEDKGHTSANGNKNIGQPVLLEEIM